MAEIYEGRLAKSYDRAVSSFFDQRKRELVAVSRLKQGDRVLVLACGTGRDFGPLLERIGAEGTILGVERSSAMLEQAHRRLRDEGWANVELLRQDLDAEPLNVAKDWDAAVCTLSLSTMPGAKRVYRELVDRVRPGGEILIGDMQLASGWRAIGNPLSVALSRRFGGSCAGHAQSRRLGRLMQAELDDVVRREFAVGAYFWCRGVKPGSPVG